MVAVLSIILIALIVFCRKGKKELEILQALDFMWLPILVVVVLSWIGPLHNLVIVLEAAICALFLISCRKELGTAFLSIGALSNLLVMMSNDGKMPVDAGAAKQTGLGVQMGHTIITDHTHLPFLADIFSTHLPSPLCDIFSIGDAIMVLGLLALYCKCRKTKQ